MKRETKRETHATTIDDNLRPHLPLPLPPPDGILDLRKCVLGTSHAFLPCPRLPLSTGHSKKKKTTEPTDGETEKEEREENINNEREEREISGEK